MHSSQTLQRLCSNVCQHASTYSTVCQHHRMAQVDRGPWHEGHSDAFLTSCNTNNWQQALQLLPSIHVKIAGKLGAQGARLASRACSHLLASLARETNWRAAQTFFKALPSLAPSIPYTPGIISAFLSSYAQKRFWQQSLDFLNSIHSGNPLSSSLDAAVYNTVITSCARASRWPWSLWLLEELISCESRPRANLLTFNAAIHACERRGLWSHALLLLQQMKENKVTPDSASLNCILSACEKGQQWQMAIALLPWFSTYKCPRTIVTYGAVAAACTAGVAWEAAIASLLELLWLQVPPSTEVFNSTVESCKRGWAWQQCLAALALELNALNSKTVVMHRSVSQSLVLAQVSCRACTSTGQSFPQPLVLRHLELKPSKLEWTGSPMVASDRWLEEANDLGGLLARHSLERNQLCSSTFVHEKKLRYVCHFPVFQDQ